MEKIYDMITVDAAQAMNVDRFGIKNGHPAHPGGPPEVAELLMTAAP